MLPEGSLADRVVLITGGGSGLGRAMALELGRLGAKVAVLGRRREPLEETVAQLSGAGVAAPADVREPGAVASAFDAAEAALGPSRRSSTTRPEPFSCAQRTCRRTAGVRLWASSSTGRSIVRGSWAAA
jgi:NAD(P)-dependent dehydrogenase (short-subunit alcohol dehydrogenase family)